MAEANHSVQQAQVRVTMSAAVMTLAKQRAIKAAKDELQALGLRPTHIPHRDIVLAANAYLAEHRAELVAEAKQIVDRWRAEGLPPRRS
jgi:hypothetical protein